MHRDALREIFDFHLLNISWTSIQSLSPRRIYLIIFFLVVKLCLPNSVYYKTQEKDVVSD